jgi:hypothetical protein
MEKINEKSVSSAQQALMGQAYGIKTGSLSPMDLDPKYMRQILDLAKNMTKKELEKFAKTKHKNLPHYVEESEGISDGMEISLEPVTSSEMPNFEPSGPGKIRPFLNPDFKQKTKGKKNLQNLKDYRDWINNK